ncbi:MAG: ribonuclease Y [Candidatus Marinimicrobia bacterium]|jgi:ribonuclease Y|nr:ribonuclease Y [Candidatus Neomarinimicrobiota bacterium]MDD4961372.1 ribonuclease Y [Candidatus Neomarinimicrobiota bacterium]MDD5709720.1 ribonuclease Y [Candidatus Neomarinimicrobiota bacterium]MDX9777707.1 ribonuclease Y [bacterium]
MLSLYLLVGFVSALVASLIVIVIFRTKIGKLQTFKTELLESARKEGETLKKELILEAKDEAIRIKQKSEDEYNEKLRDIRNMEREIQKRESNLDRKNESMDQRYESLQKFEQNLKEKETAIAERGEDLEKLIDEEQVRLEKIAGMTREEAKQNLKESLYEKARIEAQVKVREIKESAVLNANKEAKKVIIEAIQRSAADHTSESTVAVVPLPNDQMKGRVIGREGRNIRHFESLTGIELIVDDTPEAVVLSGFDPVRREVARIALEKLIQDGRIHPARIEEMIEKASKEVEESIIQAAEEATLELGLPHFNAEMMHYIGSLKYRTSYGQNILKHSIEVGWLSGLMAAELGMDGQMAKRAGFLHDIGKAIDRNVEGTHALIGAEIARRNKEDKIVVNAIESHHEEVEMIHPISALVQAADAISGSRRGARGQTLENYIHRMEKLEEISNSFKGVSKTYAIQAGREVRVIVEENQIDDAASDLLAEDIANKIQNELTYPGQIKVTVLREHRSIGYAK